MSDNLITGSFAAQLIQTSGVNNYDRAFGGKSTLIATDYLVPVTLRSVQHLIYYRSQMVPTIQHGGELCNDECV